MSGERTYSYKVAGLTFTVVAPECYDVEGLLPSFAGFRGCTGDSDSSTGSVTGDDGSTSETLFRFTLQAEAIEVPEEAKLAEVDDNDMGHTRLSRSANGSYCLELWYDHPEERQNSGSESGNDALANCATANGGAVPRPGIFIANADFTNITASVAPDSPDCGLVLTSMLRIAFAQAILRRDGISIHASAVAADGKAWLFLGKSGTGKSTHARLWLRNIPGSRLLNDDNPAVRLVDGKAVAFGTPWSGKTQCYRNESSPVGGFVRLRQGDADIFTEKEDVAAFVALLPSCSVIHSDANLQSMLYDTLTRLSERVPVGELTCLPDDESAIVCHKNIKSIIK